MSIRSVGYKRSIYCLSFDTRPRIVRRDWVAAEGIDRRPLDEINRIYFKGQKGVVVRAGKVCCQRQLATAPRHRASTKTQACTNAARSQPHKRPENPLPPRQWSDSLLSAVSH
jgi:hypothetical protein